MGAQFPAGPCPIFLPAQNMTKNYSISEIKFDLQVTFASTMQTLGALFPLNGVGVRLCGTSLVSPAHCGS